MKSNFGRLIKNNVGKILGAFIFAFMCCGVMMPVHAFAASESITGKLTLELASSGGGDVVPSGGGDSAPIDASTSTSTGEFNFLPLILGILAVGLIVLLVYLYKTGKLKNKTLSVFALCLVVSVGFCEAKSIIANAADVNDLKADNISSSAYLKFDQTGKILENNFEIINNTTETITIENVTSDSEYASILPELKGTKVAGNSTFTAKLKCELIPDFAIEKVKENQGKIEVDGFFSVAYEKEQPVPEGEAYAYKDVSQDGETALVLTYDNDKATHETVYEIATDAKEEEDWEWNNDRTSFTKVKINENFKYYNGITSTAYMFSEFFSVTSHEGFEYLDTSNVTDMTFMFTGYGQYASTLVPPNVSNWNTSKVVNMSWLFYGYEEESTTLNQVPDVSKWDTSKVTDMSGMFALYGKSSQTLCLVPEVSKWDTSKVTDMSNMFGNYGNSSLSLNTVPDVSRWNTSSVTNMSNMFNGFGENSGKLNLVPNVSSWTTPNITDTDEMFLDYGKQCIFNELDFSNFDTNKISSCMNMFQNFKLKSIKLGTNFKLALDSTNASLTNSNGDQDATWYDEDGKSYPECSIPATRTKATTYYDYNPKPEAYWDIISTEDPEGHIYRTLKIKYDTEKETWGGHDMPENATQATDWGWNSERSSITHVDISSYFKNYNGLSSTAYMFSSLSSCTVFNGAENLNVSNVNNMERMFDGCGSLSSIAIPSNWDVSKATNMNFFFSDCTNLHYNCENWITSKSCSHDYFNYGAPSVQPPHWNTIECESSAGAIAENENTLSSGDFIFDSVQDQQNTEIICPDSQQDKSSSTEADTKDKATEKTEDTQPQENPTAEETTSVSLMLVNFTSSITSFFNSLKLPVV